MTPDQQQIINQYIRSMRGRGYNDVQIKDALRESGWSDELLGEAFAETEAVTREITYTPAAAQAGTGKKKKLIVIAIICLVLLIVAAVGIFIVPNFLAGTPETTTQTTTETEEPEFALTDFVDTNFKMSIPKAWSVDAGYKPGATNITIYSPEFGIDNLSERGATMHIFSRTEKAAGQTVNTRIDSQIESIENAGGTAAVISDEDLELADQPGRLMEVTLSSKELPDKKIRLLTLTVETEDYFYHIDVAALEDYWDLHRDAARASLESFEPLGLSKTVAP